MDAAGIDMQVLSLTVPGLQADVAAGVAADDARFANDYLASVVAEHPTRFAAFAALPMQDTAAAVAELDRCVSTLGFCGALINNCLQDHYLDEPQFGHQFSRQRPGGYSGPQRVRICVWNHGQFFEQNFAPFPKGVNGIFSLRRTATSRRR